MSYSSMWQQLIDETITILTISQHVSAPFIDPIKSLNCTDVRSIALKHNQIQVVQASILGSMLVNLLPILGTALCVCGVAGQEPILDTPETQLLSCLLFVSVFVLLIPVSKRHLPSICLRTILINARPPSAIRFKCAMARMKPC